MGDRSNTQRHKKEKVGYPKLHENYY